MAVEAGGIGARLRAGREKLGLTVFQTAEKLHVDSRVVDALEGDDFAALGAPVYARGHIRHYAELVGESPTELNTLYTNLSRVEQPDLTKIAKAPPSDGANKLVVPALFMLAVFAVAGAVWWLSALSKKPPRTDETHVVAATESPPASSTVNGGAGETGGDGAAGGRGAATAGAQSAGAQSAGSAVAGNTGSSRTRSANAVNTGSAAAPARSGTGTGTGGNGGSAAAAARLAATSGANAASGRSAPPSAAAPTPAPTTAAALPKGSASNATVTLRFSADSWTEVYDASGQRLFYDVGSANSVQNFSGTYPLRVVLGNASGVSVEFNGRNQSIANQLHPDGSAQFSINRSGRVVRARPVADGG
jgi:cytoskeleton protein RodZ